MIAFQHANFSSVLACAASTALPPSPIDSPTTCYTPSNDLLDSDLHVPASAQVITAPVPLDSKTNGGGEGEDSRGCSVSPQSLPVPVPVPDPAAMVQDDERTLRLPEPVAKPAAPSPSRTVAAVSVSLTELARQIQLQNYHKDQKRACLHRIYELQIYVHLSTRLLRIIGRSQRGLVESFKHGDKPAFISLYNAIYDIRDVCESTAHRNLSGHGPFIGTGSDMPNDRAPGFATRLSAESRTGLLEILSSARADSQFLFHWISSLSASQLSVLISPVHSAQPSVTVDSYGRNQPPLFRRSTSHSSLFKDHVYSFERTDTLSALIFNLYATSPLDLKSSEARLRLETWSSTCANLISFEGSGRYTLVCHLLNIWSGLGDWKVKFKFETYLMNILQEGAFLLVQSQSQTNSSFDDFSDPMRTDVAEQFFRTSVEALFNILDDSNSGFPAGAFQFGRAVASKIGLPDSRKRFMGYLIYQWFFCQFLHHALCSPESHGMLLDFHVSKDARERILRQVAFYAQDQASQILFSPSRFSTAIPGIRRQVERMFSRLNDADSDLETIPSSNTSPTATTVDDTGNQVLMLSSTDVLTILDAISPRSTPAHSPPDLYSSQSFPSPSVSTSFVPSSQPGQAYDSGLFRANISSLSPGSTTGKSGFTTETSFQDASRSHFVLPNNRTSIPEPVEQPRARIVDRIRYEISEMRELEDKQGLGHPANEDWAIFSIVDDSSINIRILEDDDSSLSARQIPIENRLIKEVLVDKRSRIEAAVGKLCRDFSVHEIQAFSPRNGEKVNLKHLFVAAMDRCRRRSDFVGAHFWWESSQLLGPVSATESSGADAKYLTPMLSAAENSIEVDSLTIRNCERVFIDLKEQMEQLRLQLDDSMNTLAGLRDKMWYMTDVKNSLRYEDAKNVALALKSMAILHAMPPSPAEPKAKLGSRTLGGSFLQGPQVQVLNIMRAPRDQGGPFKLSDEQVEITKKWHQRFGIDNFCQGEERIHRFCYEVRACVSKLVGESMYETPVLWSSELFQHERVALDISGSRPLSAGVRSSSIFTEDSSCAGNSTVRSLDQLFRPPSDVPLLGRQLSFQYLNNYGKWKSRDIYGDTLSVNDSPGKTVASNSTADSIQPFWSPVNTQTQSSISASSLRSRPPSMFSDSGLLTRKLERSGHQKLVFLDKVKQNLTSLLLSDLGSPVWSCGSETDAWFSDYLNESRIRDQIIRRERKQKFLSQCSTTTSCREKDASRVRLRRCFSSPSLRTGSQSPIAGRSRGDTNRVTNADEESVQCNFGYDEAYERLMDKFSRPANPFVKLDALHNIWTLVSAPIRYGPMSEEIDDSLSSYSGPHGINRRNSFTTVSKTEQFDETPTTPAQHSPSLTANGSATGLSLNDPKIETQIINSLKELIQKFRPKTLFRDLQYIAAFVPSDILNKTESGTAFLQFGLAALKFKDEVCNSMIDIADGIVSQELAQRHRCHSCGANDYSARGATNSGIKDAANMWIITAKEGNPIAQRELAILYLTHPHLLRPVTLPLTRPGDTFKTEAVHQWDNDPKSDPQNMCLALHWMQLSAAGGDELAKNRLRERAEFESISVRA